MIRNFVRPVCSFSSPSYFLLSPFSFRSLKIECELTFGFHLPMLESNYWKSAAFPDTSSPMIKPKSPRTELKISMTRILTNLRRVSNMPSPYHPLSDPTRLHPPSHSNQAKATNEKQNSQTRIRGVRQRSPRAINAHTNTTDQITHADGQAGPKQRIAGVVVAARVHLRAFDRV
jgi:hypothetical protein